MKTWRCGKARAKLQKVFASFFKKKCFLPLCRSTTTQGGITEQFRRRADAMVAALL